MENSTTFHQPLPHARCTRLVHILDDEPEGDSKLLITITLLDLDHIVDIPSNENNSSESTREEHRSSDYDALSYTWGSPFSTAELKAKYTADHDVPITIVVESERYPFKIGRNLYEALSNFHRQSIHRPLWVDSLCINQSDLDEREVQVLLMGQIYSKATHVLVWLGVDDPDLPTFESVSLLLTDIAPRVHHCERQTGSTTTWTLTMQNDEPCLLNKTLDLTVSKATMSAWYRFLGRRRWFARAWIMQEIILARKSIILLAEKAFDPFDLIWWARKCVTIRNYARMFYYQEETLETSGGDVELFGIGTMSKQYHLATTASPASSGVFWDLLREFYGTTDTKSDFLATLYHLLATVHRRGSTDPRDSIYSLLGVVNSILPDVQSPVIPNYREPVEQIFTEITSLMLTYLPHRDVLSLVYTKESSTSGVNRSSDLILPSWVVNFKLQYNEICPISVVFLLRNIQTTSPKLNRAGYTAGFDNAQYSSLRISGGELILYARRCGKIDPDYCGEFQRLLAPNLETGHSLDHLERMAHSCLDILICLLSLPMYLGIKHPNGHTIVEVLFRTVCDATPLRSRIPDPDFNQKVASQIMTLMWGSYLILMQSGSPSAALMYKMGAVIFLMTLLNGQPCIPRADQVEELVHLTWRNLSREEFLQTLLHNVNERNLDKTMFFIHPGVHLFVTDNRYIGRVFSAVKPGDELWLICQARSPFVLRPTGDGKYLLVGEALVDGAMEGELIKNGVAGPAHEITIV